MNKKDFYSRVRLPSHQFYTSFSRQFRPSLVSDNFILSLAECLLSYYTSFTPILNVVGHEDSTYLVEDFLSTFTSYLGSEQLHKNKRVWISPHPSCLDGVSLKNVVRVFALSCATFHFAYFFELQLQTVVESADFINQSTCRLFRCLHIFRERQTITTTE